MRQQKAATKVHKDEAAYKAAEKADKDEAAAMIDKDETAEDEAAPKCAATGKNAASKFCRHGKFCWHAKSCWEADGKATKDEAAAKTEKDTADRIRKAQRRAEAKAPLQQEFWRNVGRVKMFGQHRQDIRGNKIICNNGKILIGEMGP